MAIGLFGNRRRPPARQWRQPLAKEEWGEKRWCPSCGAKFYDMKRRPIVCPKCDGELALIPPKPSRPPVEEKPPIPAAIVIKKAAMGGDDLDDDDDDDLVADKIDDDDDDDDEGLMEDVSDIDDADEDMSEVLVHADGSESHKI